MSELDKVRVDKWLWAVRIFKTRTAASKACDQGKVKKDGESLKASKQIIPGDLLEVRVNYRNRTFKVIRLLEKRVGAAIAEACYEDLSPPETKETRYHSAFVHHGQRERGSGRPTKKERREIDRFKDDF
jgi:ribosome-associated heat shock protein Hsp15